ncbi:hypothetical protein ASZ90_014808 [hydrocarbon metagenome]|uniref:Uncharacterized protein n=1 Tax=hydrocarbon metagenome TaxID=938273 RepID=A0A0W8F3P1_9ZZZZ
MDPLSHPGMYTATVGSNRMRTIPGDWGQYAVPFGIAFLKRGSFIAGNAIYFSAN